MPGWLEEQLNIRKQNDTDAFEDSCLKIAGSVMGQNLTAALRSEREQATDAIGSIMNYYHAKVREVPDKLESIEEVLEYLLRPYGIMIARAIAPKPKILMFDEATSALDNITQKQVSDSLDSLKCTRIVIAHRLSTIRNCDRIVVLDEGRIVEDGTYDELMAKNGFFAALVARQQVNPSPIDGNAEFSYS